MDARDEIIELHAVEAEFAMNYYLIMYKLCINTYKNSEVNI